MCVCDTRWSPLVPPRSRRSTRLRLLHLLPIQVVLRLFSCLHLPHRCKRPQSDGVCPIMPHVQHCPWYLQPFFSGKCSLASSKLHGPFFPVSVTVHPHPSLCPCLSFDSLSRSVSSSRTCNTSMPFGPCPHLLNLHLLARCNKYGPPPSATYIALCPARVYEVSLVVYGTTIAFLRSRRETKLDARQAHGERKM